VVRLGKVFDLVRGSGTLLDEMAGRLLRGEPVAAARDQLFCPTFIDDVVNIVRRLLVADMTGIVNLCAPQKISRLELAHKIADTFRCDNRLIRNILLHELRETAVRPRDTSMVSRRAVIRLQCRFKSIEDSLKELRSLYK